MALKRSPEKTPDGAAWEPVRGALEALEQAAATGWYPARRELLSRLSDLPRARTPVWVPEADVEETPREIAVTFALPGVEKADIRLSAAEDALTVSGRRREDVRPPETCRRELPRGEFLRRVRLPVEVKPETARASLKNGLLRVTLQRARVGAGRSVKVE